eukprot:scaffold27654_cov95-Skeletonema_marinoi.AAC.1
MESETKVADQHQVRTMIKLNVTMSQGYDCGTVPDTVPTVILPVHTCQVATTSCFVVDPLTEMTSHVDARSSPL